MLGTFAKFALFFTGVFGVSLGTTISITRIQEKIRYERSQQEDKEDEEEVNYTHLDYFIEELTSLKYLDADLEIEIKVNDAIITINSDLYLDLNISDIAKSNADVNLNVKYDTLNEDLKLIYNQSTAYIDVLDQHLMMEEASINELIDLIASFDIPISLPEELKNIDINDLLNRLGQMEVNEYQDKITYTFNMFKDKSPIIFTSDLNHKLTKIETNDLTFNDTSISLVANTNVLEQGKEIISPIDKYSYKDVSGYFGILKDISKILDKKQFALNFALSAYRLNEDALSLTGHANIDYENLNIDLSSHIKGPSIDADVTSYYTSEERIYLNYDNRFKFRYDKQNLLDLIDLIKDFIDEEALDVFLNHANEFSLPIIDLIKEGRYLELFNQLDIKMLDNQVIINMPNSLMFGGDESIVITLDSTYENIVDVKINDLFIENYKFNLILSLDNYVAPSLPSDIDKYQDLAPVNNVVDYLLKQYDESQLAFSLNGSLTPVDSITPKASFTGFTQFDFSNSFSLARLKIDDDQERVHNIAFDVYDIASKIDDIDIDESNATTYFTYNEKLKGSFSLKNLRGLFDTIINLINSDNPRWKQYFDALVNSPLFTIVKAIQDGEYEKALIGDIIDEVSITDSKMMIDFNGKLFDEEESNLKITLNYPNYEVSSLSVEGSLFDYDIALTLAKQTYDPSTPILDLNDNYTDFSDIKILADYLIKTAELNTFHLTGTVTLDITALIIPLGGTADLDLYISIDEEERVYVMGSITNIPTVYEVNAECLSCSNRDCYFYYDGSENEDYVYIYAEQTEKPIFSSNYVAGKYTKVNSKDFGIGVLKYICGVGLGLSDEIIEDIGGGEERTTPMRFEEILKSYAFDKNETKWDLNLNLNEIANDDVFYDLEVMIQGDNDGYLSKIKASTGMSIIDLIYISIDLDATLNRNETIFPWDEFNAYIVDHKNDVDGDIVYFTR